MTEFRAWALSLLGPRGGRQGFSTRHPKESHRAAMVVHGTLACFIKIGVLKSLDLASRMTTRGSTTQHLLKTGMRCLRHLSHAVGIRDTPMFIVVSAAVAAVVSIAAAFAFRFVAQGLNAGQQR